MSGIKKVKAGNLFPLVSDLLEQGQKVKISVSGNSMYPFLRDGIDSVEFAWVSFEEIVRGDIVLIRRTGGDYVMHRVYRKNEKSFYMVGDAQQWIEGPLYPQQLVAVVSAIWRKERRIPCSDSGLKLLVRIWLTLRPCRYIIFRLYRKLLKIFGILQK